MELAVADIREPPGPTAYEKAPELIIGIISPTGVDKPGVLGALRAALGEVGYSYEPVKLSELLRLIPKFKTLPVSPEETRIHGHMDAGDEVRTKTESGEALALLGIAAIRAKREEKVGHPDRPVPRTAFVIDSLKHPDEVRRLREIYGGSFFLIACYSPRESRVHHLARHLAESQHVTQADEFLAKAQTLIGRDEAEAGTKYGQNTRETYPLADVFIDARHPERVKKSIDRFVDLVFGYPFHTPTKPEYGMFHAKAAALRSADLARQVGVAIASADGEIIVVGTNEVPKAGGGLYWEDDPFDHRDHVVGHDTITEMKNRMVLEVLARLTDGSWIAPEKRLLASSDARTEVLQLLKGTQALAVTEFGRSVHAEMAAITEAARRGVEIRGAILFTTTFPCHNCAKHIVAAGLGQVVYIEPYPKSLAGRFYPDSISIDADGRNNGKVAFEPFVGIAPRRFVELFEAPKRKDDSGKKLEWNRQSASPRLPLYAHLSYIHREKGELEYIQRRLVKARLQSGLL